MTREELLQAIQRLDEFEFGPGAETDRDALLSILVNAVPHSYVSALLYQPERERTNEEVADEALLRERMWLEHGEKAVLARIESQLLEALSDPSVPDNHHSKISARRLLASIRDGAIRESW